MPQRLAAAILLACLSTGGAQAEEGMASWYGSESGRVTASGERFHPDGIRQPDGSVAFTCARPSYRSGRPTYPVRVTDVATGRSIVCRVNDRGPRGDLRRTIDLCRGAMIALVGADRRGRPTRGLLRVKVERIP